MTGNSKAVSQLIPTAAINSLPQNPISEKKGVKEKTDSFANSAHSKSDNRDRARKKLDDKDPYFELLGKDPSRALRR
ncbi:hypothetical protein TNIN_118941 [Trichonephila inaurata madagascariensis]|uniref:Uncharacterized protein n=1 Tax=Trichonephila inaurata madagascariensis TaxID=2747483 RepID=A0A8X6YWK7_9ARAC|nr:hypothetical protein TNIN_118941 [Trichonephila inaurata madagascariensis]